MGSKQEQHETGKLFCASVSFHPLGCLLHFRLHDRLSIDAQAPWVDPGEVNFANRRRYKNKQQGAKVGFVHTSDPLLQYALDFAPVRRFAQSNPCPRQPRPLSRTAQCDAYQRTRKCPTTQANVSPGARSESEIPRNVRQATRPPGRRGPQQQFIFGRSGRDTAAQPRLPRSAYTEALTGNETREASGS